MVRKSVVIGLVVAVLIVGGVMYGILSQVAAMRGLEVVNLGIEDVNVEGINPLTFDFIPDRISLTYYVDVHNPSPYDVVVKKIFYVMTIEGRYAGEGSVYNIEVPSGMTKRIRIPFETSAEAVMSVVGDAVRRGDNIVDYKVKGYLEVPIKIWGVIDLGSFRVPIEYRGYLELPALPGMKPKATFINAYWLPQSIRLGDTAVAIVEIAGPQQGKLVIEIMKDIPVMPDKVVATKEYYIDIPSGEIRKFEILFKPDEPSSWKLRGYYIVVYINGKKLYESDRLKVSG